MAIRKPIVLVDGALQQIPAGDTLEGVSADVVDIGLLSNATSGLMTLGMPVYVSSPGEVSLARANALATSRAIALVKASQIVGFGSGELLTNGLLSGTVTQWASVTGESGGLTAGSNYYLSAAEAGKLSKSLPSSAGEFVVLVGRAVSATTLMISIQEPIGL